MDISNEVVLADAAAWIARLQRSDRTRATEAAFHEWLKDPAHAEAFARVTDLWEIIPGAAQLLESSARTRKARLAGRALAATGIIGVIAVGATMYLARSRNIGLLSGSNRWSLWRMKPASP